MNFGWDLTTPYGRVTALHEIGHPLGFPHEHQSPKSGIEWNTRAVYEEFSGPPNHWKKRDIDHNILSKLKDEEVRGFDWDPTSVMHYHFRAGLILKPDHYQTHDLPPPAKLSAKDIEYVRTFYPPISHGGRSVLEPFNSARIILNPMEQLDFSIIPDESRLYTIQTFGNMDVIMVLFDGEDMSTIKGKDNSGSNASALLSVDLEKDKEYVLSLRLNYGDQEGGSGRGSVMFH